MSTLEEIAFCMIPLKDPKGNVSIFPLPSEKCHCAKLEQKHFSLYGRYNEDKTQMTPSSQEDVKRLEEYYLNINLVK